MCYFKRILVVDLTTGEHHFEDIDDEVVRKFVGGYGLGAWYTFTRQKGTRIDPLGPENILSFCPGLLNRTGTSYGGRFMVTAKSPLSGGWGDANCGGRFGPALRSCGLDLLAIHGAAEEPSVIVIDGDEVEIRPAGELWGLDAPETERALEAELGNGVHVCAIGTAGERLVRFAGIVNHGGRIAARSGLGAVMGSKKLKAVVARGKKKTPPSDKKVLTALTKAYNHYTKADTRYDKVNEWLVRKLSKLSPLLRVAPFQVKGEGIQFKHILKQFGTCGLTPMSAEVGDSPVKNWAGSGSHDFPLKTHALHLDGPLVKEREAKPYFCSQCPLGCGGINKCAEGEHAGHKPEYETICALGTNCLVHDIDLIFKLNDRLNHAGVDSITMGAIAAMAFEAWEKGLIGPDQTDGVALEWGSTTALEWLVEKTIAREGIGDILANGIKEASETLGCEECAMHAGGEALPMHDTRYDPTFALAYSSEPTPGRHTIVSQTYVELMGLERKIEGVRAASLPLYRKKSKYDPTGQGTVMALATRYVQVANCLGLCEFGFLTGDAPVLEWTNAATGWEWTMEDLLRTGECIETIRHAYNVREGIRPADFRLPDRVLGRPPLKTGPLKGIEVDVETMQQDFFNHLGWDLETGRPRKDRLEAIGLGFVNEALDDAAATV